MVDFSFLVPTRQRLQLVRRLLDSLVENTERPERIEVILGIDDDDKDSQFIKEDRLVLKKVIVSRGSTMGELNDACFKSSTGRFVMLLNDDVILRTKGWDGKILSVIANYSDEVVLIHTNDLLFREKLCTFPMVSRRACEEIGLCPREYRKYKIDDHIYDIYSLLAYLGHKRIIYLEDVIFEHDNYSKDCPISHRHVFRSADNKLYIPKKEIIEEDDKIFVSKLSERKEAALKLAELIDRTRYQRMIKCARNRYASQLGGINDSYSYRSVNLVIKRRDAGGGSGREKRTTIAVVTSDVRSEHAVRCISSIKKYTENYELLILDNNRNIDFSHPKEMNWVLRNAETEYVVLMDDDVFVEEGWLEGLLDSVDENTGVVAPVHKDGRGMLSFSGAYFSGDGAGTHEHTFDMPSEPREMMIYCSACILIDMRKCGHILMDESYRKFFFDLVHGLEVWESGYKAICTPRSIVTHVGGATIKWGSENSNALLRRDRQIFIQQWVKTGRLGRLERGIWQNYPYLRLLVDISRRIERVGASFQDMDVDEFGKEIECLIDMSRNFNLYKENLKKQLGRILSQQGSNHHPGKLNVCREALKKLETIKREESWYPSVTVKKTPIVSAIVSTWNSERFIKGLLDDLLAQTIADSMEIVIVDSNSDENEGAVVREYQKRYNNIVYLRTSERESSHKALNRCIELARGKYLTLACTDDRHRKDAVERMVRELEARSNIALVYADVAITDRENQTFETAAIRGYYRWPDFDRKLLFQICYIGPQPVWRRELHERYGYFDPEFWSAGDYEFWLRICKHEEFLHIPEVLGLYYISPTSNEHKNMTLNFQEAERARERYWPKEWGKRPTPFFNKNPFVVSAVSSSPSDAVKDRVAALKDQGITFYSWGDPSGAEVALKQALALDPNNVDILVSLGRILYETKRYQEAIKCLEKAVSVNPKDVDGYVGLALVAYELKDFGKCKGACEKAIDLDPFHPIAGSLARVLRLKSGQRPEEKKAFSGAAISAREINEQGEILFKQGKVEEARDLFLRSLETDSRFAPALNNLGVVNFYKGEIGEAISLFNQALEIDPDFADAAENLKRCTEIQESCKAGINPA